MRISDWSSDVCSSDLLGGDLAIFEHGALGCGVPVDALHLDQVDDAVEAVLRTHRHLHRHGIRAQARTQLPDDLVEVGTGTVHLVRSEEHTSELQSLMRISYAVFCLKKKHNTSYNSH